MNGNFKDTPVKILTVGDSGVGKSLLASILTGKNGGTNQCKWTIGANTVRSVYSATQIDTISQQIIAILYKSPLNTPFIQPSY